MQSKAGVSYYVQLSDGDVHRVSLDQLDEGFQAGHIDENTMVLADGASKWVTLGDLAGLDDEVPVEIESYPARMPSSAPFAGYAPRVITPAYPSVAPARTAPISARPPTLAAPILPSHRPVSIDLGEMNQFRQGSGRRWFAALVAISVLGGLGTAAIKRPALAQTYLGRLGIHLPGAKPVPALPSLAAPPSLAAAAAAPPVVAPPPPAAAPPPIVTTAPAAPPESTARSEPPHAVGSKDKTPRQHAAAAPAHPMAHPKARTSSFVTTGGGKFDPLGSSI